MNQLEIAERTARTYLMQCGNNVVEHENVDSFMAEVLYMLLNRKTSTETPFSAACCGGGSKVYRRRGCQRHSNFRFSFAGADGFQ